MAGGPLLLGGVKIAHDQHLFGHSDADALLHAITDALLGAAGLGDIGEWFPDTADENRGRDSTEMLAHAHAQLRTRNFEIANLDCVIFAQQPKLSKYKPAMTQRIAEILEIQPDQVGIKAKTGEHVGPIGRGEAISTQCVALIFKSPVFKPPSNL